MNESDAKEVDRPPLDTDPRATRQRDIISLRNQVRGLRRVVVGLSIAVAAALSLAVFTAFKSNLTASEVRLVSPGGSTRAMLNFDDGYPQLVFYDREGVKRAVFDEAGLILWGNDGTTMLREIGDASRLEFKRKFGGRETMTWLVNDGVRQQLLLKNKISQEEVRVALEGSKGARIRTYDEKNGAFSIPAEVKGDAEPGADPAAEPGADPEAPTKDPGDSNTEDE